MITGFRLAPGGAQQFFGVTPDLTTLGKIIGGGMPVGAYGGRKEIMECVAPLGNVYQAGTLSGNPIAMTAGLVTLKRLFEHPEIYTQIEQTTKTLADAYRNAFKDQVCVNQIGSLMSVFFTKEKVVDFASGQTSDRKKYADYFCYFLERGIHLAPSQFEAMFVSVAHHKEDVEKTIQVIDQYAASQKR